MAYDQSCHDLARVFLGDLASEPLVAKLAQHVQDAVEDWIETERAELAPSFATPFSMVQCTFHYCPTPEHCAERGCASPHGIQ